MSAIFGFIGGVIVSVLVFISWLAYLIFRDGPRR